MRFADRALWLLLRIRSDSGEPVFLPRTTREQDQDLEALEDAGMIDIGHDPAGYRVAIKDSGRRTLRQWVRANVELAALKFGRCVKV